MRYKPEDFERHTDMRNLLDQFQGLVDQMVVQSNWHKVAEEDELTALILMLQLLAQDFKDAITNIKGKKHGRNKV